MSLVKADQVHVGKHFKVTSDFGKLVIDSSKDALGLFLSGNGHHGSLNIVLQRNGTPYISIWPKAGYFNDKVARQLPFAISADGIQVPRKDGTTFSVSFDKLVEILEKL